jgi:phospholipase C
MMENRSFDHMLGSLKAVDARIDGVTDQLTNPDSTDHPLHIAATLRIGE